MSERTTKWTSPIRVVLSMMVVCIGLFLVLLDFATSRAWQWMTVWAGVQAIVTVAALIAAVVLWRETAAQRETNLMLRLVDEYDALREDVECVVSYFRFCAGHGPTDPLKNFANNIHAELQGERAVAVDAARYRVSRYFVRIRKLVCAGYLSEAIVISALDRRAIELFLEYIDPLDGVKAGWNYRADDYSYFSGLLSKYPTDESDESRRVTDE